MMKNLSVLILMYLMPLLSGSVHSPNIQVKNGGQQPYYKPLKSFNGDTSGYLIRNFVTYQQDYQNKALNTMLEKLEVPVAGYLVINGGNKGEEVPTKCVGIYLRFFSWKDIEQKKRAKQNPAVLYVRFKTPIALEEANVLRRRNKGAFPDSVRMFYSKQIVDTINYVHYKYKKVVKR